ncbi:MAG TPA: radical SAM protein, partial [Sedimentisphaerales bacterium]|nr:radical SAM protein [Sedimentisphaerales bacterium]
IAGGGMANCCEPMAEFIDVFVLGEGEQAIIELAQLIREQKKAGALKEHSLGLIAERFDWAYVPSHYKGGTLKSAVVEDFENAPVPLAPIVPFVEAVHERVSVEIMRGCPGRCRFCQASFCRRPIRYRSVDKIIEIAKACYHSTGFDTVSLLSLSSADYPKLDELVAGLHSYFADKHVGLSLPSLRVDKQLKLLPEVLTSVRKGGITIAVEAASEKLRRIINKPLKDEDLFAAAEAAYRAGWQKLKLYFMVGLPGETLDDVKRIVPLSLELARLRKAVAGRAAQINITVSWFVPKPHTPLAWLGQKPRAYFEQARQLILDEKRKLGVKFLQFKFHDIGRSILESAIGRGDRRLGDVIEAAWRAGAKFDLWDECFNFELWRSAFEQSGIDLDAAAQRQFNPAEALPWDHLGGPNKKYLLNHLEEANKEIENSECAM